MVVYYLKIPLNGWLILFLYVLLCVNEDYNVTLQLDTYI